MQNDEPSLVEILQRIWKARIPVFLFSVFFCTIGMITVFSITPLYRASMIVAPADGYALGDYASSVSDGESLSIPFWRPQEDDGVSTDFHRFVYTVKGPAVAEILLKDSVVLSGIARDKGFSKNTVDWKAEDLSAYLEKKIKIQNLGATPLKKMTYHHSDSAFAAAFLRKIHLVSDQLIRRDRRRQSESRIQYLQDTLQKTLNPDHRRGIADLLVQQEHVQMLANLDEPYAAIVVEAPSSSPRPVWPDRPLFVFLFTLMGAVTGYLFYCARGKKV